MARRRSLLWAVADADTWRLKVGDELVTPPGLQVRGVTHAGDVGAVHRVERSLGRRGLELVQRGGLRQVTDLGGVSSAIGDGRVQVVVSRSMARDGVEGSRAHGRHGAAGAGRQGGNACSRTGRPFPQSGTSPGYGGRLTAVQPRRGKLAVIMAPYGAPGHQKVMAAEGQVWLEASGLRTRGSPSWWLTGAAHLGAGRRSSTEVYPGPR